MLRRQQPQILINNRADMPEDFHSLEGDAAVGDFDDHHPWELCTTISRQEMAQLAPKLLMRLLTRAGVKPARPARTMDFKSQLGSLAGFC